MDSRWSTRSRPWRRFALAAASLALLGAGPAQAARSVIGQPPGSYVPGEVLVKFRAGTSASARAQAVAAQGGQQLRDLDRRGLVHVRLPAGERVPDALAAYRRDPSVEYAQPNYVYRALATPNDPRYGDLWGLKNIGQRLSSPSYLTNNPGLAGMDVDAELAWDVTTDCRAVIVAVVDTGVNYTHGDLAANMWDGGAANPKHGRDFVDNDDDPMDTNGHGTHVAGTIGAVGNNANGTTGVCWTAQLMAVRVLDTLGSGSTAGIVQGVDFAITNGARVINMSLGGPADPATDPAFSAAITSARNDDVVVVVAAGNEASNNEASPVYPCNFTHANLVCVAALDQAYALASFSNWGGTSVDVGAPGANIVSEWAGTEAVAFSDDFSFGVGNWTFSPTGQDWIASLQNYGPLIYVMSDPSTFNGRYSSNVDYRAYRSFDFSTVDAATISFYADVSVRDAGDFFRIAYGPAGGVPGLVLDELTNGWTGFSLVPLEYEIPASCLVATCTVGFNLQSDADATVDYGVELAFFEARTLTLNSTSYHTINGTSMASPHVAGLAAMIRAYNPQYTYLDVVRSITNGGTPLGALAGKTTTGRAVNAMGSLAYISPPTGVTATLAP